MGEFTFIPVWVIQDIVVLILAAITVVFIVKNEEHPASVLMEFFCFVFLFAGVYENFATLIGLYGYGKSVLMLFNVPITVPIIEYIVVYCSLRLFNYIKAPMAVKPLLVGFMGMLFDFTLDPLAINQVFATKEATIGRWSWFPGAGDVNIFGEPVYNFTGWILICGIGALFILLGRWWHQKTNRNAVVGYAYPVVGMIAGLLLVIAPSSQFLLWLEPIFPHRGMVSEWIMLGAWFIVLTTLTAIYFHRSVRRMSMKREYLIFAVFGVCFLSNLVFTIIGGYFQVFPLIAGFVVFQSAIILGIYFMSKRAPQ